MRIRDLVKLRAHMGFEEEQTFLMSLTRKTRRKVFRMEFNLCDREGKRIVRQTIRFMRGK